MYENIDDNGRIVVCRKNHFCEWCDEHIFKGEQAVVRVYKFNGDFNSSHMHPECFKALQDSFSKGLMWDGEFNPSEQGRGCLIGESEGKNGTD